MFGRLHSNRRVDWQPYLIPVHRFCLTRCFHVNTNEPKRKLILLADDNEDVLVVTKSSLELLGYRVVECSSGREAIKSFAAIQPDALIIDLGLSDISGIEVGQRLKAMNIAKNCRLILYTGTDEPSLRDAAAKAGFDDFLVKPVRMNVLAECIEGV